MQRTLFYSKIHRAVVTEANLEYEGSLTIDAELMRAADIREHEAVHVWNVTRGTRLVTYALAGEPGSGTICVNGAAAHGNQVGDLVIIATFAQMNEAEMARHEPRVVRVDARNRITGYASEVPGRTAAMTLPAPATPT